MISPQILPNIFLFIIAIVYKILYEVVFKVTDLDYAVSKMLHDKAARAQRERYLTQQQIGGKYVETFSECCF